MHSLSHVPLVVVSSTFDDCEGCPDSRVWSFILHKVVLGILLVGSLRYARFFIPVGVDRYDERPAIILFGTLYYARANRNKVQGSGPVGT